MRDEVEAQVVALGDVRLEEEELVLIWWTLIEGLSPWGVLNAAAAARSIARHTHTQRLVTFLPMTATQAIMFRLSWG